MLWSAIENGSMVVLSFLSLIVFAKFLTPADFGVYSVAIAVIEIVGILTNMLFHDALIQREEISDAHFDGALTVSIVLGVLACLILWLTFPWLALLVGDVRVVDVGRALALGLLVAAPTSVLVARQKREFGFRLLAVRTLLGRICGAVLGVVAAIYGLGIWSLVIQYLSMLILGTMTLVLSSQSRPHLTRNLRPVRELFAYGSVAVVSLFVNFSTKRIFIFCVGVFLGVDKAGFLNLAFRTVDTLWSVSATAISQVLLPSMSRLQSDREKLLNAYRKALQLAALLIYPLFTGLGVLAPEIIELLFGQKWAPASAYMFALSLMVFLQVPNLFAVPLLSTTGNLRVVRLVNVVAFLYMAIAISTTRLPQEGWALAIWIFSETIVFSMYVIFLAHRLKITVISQLRCTVLPFAASLLMILAIQLLKYFVMSGFSLTWKLPTLIVFGALAYALFLLLGDHRIFGTIFGLLKSVRKKS